MLDLTKPLQAKNGMKATILHQYYNGVQDMMVVSLLRSTPFGKDVEIIKTYDQRWGKVDGNPSSSPADPWDLELIPPPDITTYVVMTATTAYHRSIKQDIDDWSGYNPHGQLKVVVDGRTGKIKSADIL